MGMLFGLPVIMQQCQFDCCLYKLTEQSISIVFEDQKLLLIKDATFLIVGRH